MQSNAKEDAKNKKNKSDAKKLKESQDGHTAGGSVGRLDIVVRGIRITSRAKLNVRKFVINLNIQNSKIK